jgi:diaminopimelate epimerase
VDSGTPHFVVFVTEVETAPLAQWGPELRRHAHFGGPGANVDLVEESRPGRLSLRTWERGVEGETLACGSGAVAAAFAAGLRGGDHVRRWEVVPASGVALDVAFEGPAESPTATSLAGDARFVFEAEVDPEAAQP